MLSVFYPQKIIVVGILALIYACIEVIGQDLTFWLTGIPRLAATHPLKSLEENLAMC